MTSVIRGLQVRTDWAEDGLPMYRRLMVQSYSWRRTSVWSARESLANIIKAQFITVFLSTVDHKGCFYRGPYTIKYNITQKAISFTIIQKI